MKSQKQLKEFGNIVKELQRLTRQLVDIIDKQTQAVVSADRDKIEHFAEEYTQVKGSFEEQEHKFVNFLEAAIEDQAESNKKLRLENLKSAFPGSTEKISEWQKNLGKQTRKLKQKHQKLNTLLEFAMKRNVELMQSIYSLHNQKNTRYSSGGDKEEISSGIAVNKEA